MVFLTIPETVESGFWASIQNQAESIQSCASDFVVSGINDVFARWKG